MAKKKQPDFQPTKLRVGKSLPKGKNVTNTSFKSKKIITKDQNLKSSSETASLTELIRMSHHTNVSAKLDAIKRLVKYIEQNVSSLTAYFSEILSSVGKILLDYHPKVRQEVVELMKVSIELLSNSQMSSYMTMLTSHLDCMMTHLNVSIKKDSLDLLNAILETHPHLICHSTKLLSNLLNMISSVKPQKKGDTSQQKKRKLDDNISSTITSIEWRDQVMTLIVKFLEKLVETYSVQKDIFQDEQKVHWDGKQALFVPLYSRSGLSPAKLELSSSLAKPESEVTRDLRQFFSHLVSVTSGIVTEEVATFKSLNSGYSLRLENLERLNTVAQVLCCLADWYKLCTQVVQEDDFLHEMNNILRKKLMKGFCYSLQESGTKKPGKKNRELTCAHLNLGIGYLYTSFILGTELEDTKTEKLILACVSDALIEQQHSEDPKSISFVLEILKSFLKDIAMYETKREYKLILTPMLSHLSGTLITCKDKNVVKDIQSFFIKLSLDLDYKFLVECDALNCFIRYNLHYMKEMGNEKKACHNMLKCINQVCIRQYPAFMDALKGADAMQLIGCLKFGDEEYQFTVLNVITHMTNLPADFLQDVAQFILDDPSLPVKLVEKLIRMLFDRFSDANVPPTELGDFVRFLMNICLDVVTFEKYLSGDFGEDVIFFEEESGNSNGEEGERVPVPLDLIPIKNILQHVQKTYFIYPSLLAERHSEITEVAIQCLLLIPDRDLVIQLASMFYKELYVSNLIFPVHSAIGLLKLYSSVFMFEGCMLSNTKANGVQEQLLVSGLYYISVMTNLISVDKFKVLGVTHLQNALCLNEENCVRAVELIDAVCYSSARVGLSMEYIYYTLRIVKCLIARQKIRAREMMESLQFMQIIDHFCRRDQTSPEFALLHEVYKFV